MCRTGPTGQRGSPLEVDRFERKISTWAEPFHLGLVRKFRKLWHNESKRSVHVFDRLRVVPHFFLRDSRASETRGRVKITPREKRRRSTIPEEKWGTTRSLF